MNVRHTQPLITLVQTYCHVHKRVKCDFAVVKVYSYCRLRVLRDVTVIASARLLTPAGGGCRELLFPVLVGWVSWRHACLFRRWSLRPRACCRPRQESQPTSRPEPGWLCQRRHLAAQVQGSIVQTRLLGQLASQPASPPAHCG